MVVHLRWRDVTVWLWGCSVCVGGSDLWCLGSGSYLTYGPMVMLVLRGDLAQASPGMASGLGVGSALLPLRETDGLHVQSSGFTTLILPPMIIPILPMQKLRPRLVEYFSKATQRVQLWMMRGRTPGFSVSLLAMSGGER